MPGFNWAIRRTGEKWRTVDPKGFDLGDILDLPGDILSLVGMLGGGAVATTLGGVTTGPGGLALGSAGAATGSALAQAVRSGIGSALGYTPTQEEMGRAVGQEFLIGGVAEVGGRALARAAQPVGRFLRRRGLRKPEVGLAPETVSQVAGRISARPETRLALERLAAIGPEERFEAEFARRTFGREITGPQGIPDPERIRIILAQRGLPEDRLMMGEAHGWALRQGLKKSIEQLERLGVNTAGVDSVQKAGELYYAYLRGGLKNMGLAYDPVERALIGPVVDVERLAVQTQMLGRAPRGAEVDFWRSIPIEGLKRLRIRGVDYYLSNDQAKALKFLTWSYAFGRAGRKAAGKALSWLSNALRLPRTVLLTTVKVLRFRQIERFIHLVTGGAMRTGTVGLGAWYMGGPVAGGPFAAILGLDVAGQMLGKLSHALMSDTRGNLLRSLLPLIDAPSAMRRAGQALRFAELGQGSAYRATIFELLHQPEFSRLLERMGQERTGGVQDRGRRPVQQGGL